MTIGINARFLTRPYTGIGQYTLNLIQGLVEIDSQNHYLLFTPELVELSLPENFEQIRVQEKPYRSASLRKAYWEHQLVPKEMQKRHVNLAHFPYPANPWSKLPFPVVVTVHDVIPWSLPEYRSRLRSKLYHFYARRALYKADHLITVSEFSKQEIHRLFKSIPAKNITVIGNSTPGMDLLGHPDLSLRRNYFLYVGGYDSRKNVPYLMDVFQKTIAPHFPVDLILVGGSEHDLEPFITDKYCEKITDVVHLKNKGKVILTASLEESQLHFLYQKALSFVHLSHYEGFNIPLLEAMHFGVPALVSDLPVHHEVAQDAALYVPVDDADALSGALKKMIHEPHLRDSLISKGKKRAAHFSLKKHAERTLEVYNLFS